LSGALGIAAAVRSGARSAVSVAEEALARIAALDGDIGAVTRVLRARALEEARAVDAVVAGGGDPGPLAGVPYAVKDLFDVAGYPTTAGAAMRADAAPASADAEAIVRMCAAGAVLVACTNMDEFAYGFATINAAYGTTRNPHDLMRLAGGSSGGSAAMVASGMVPLALGSDTNGSVRVPAALCGVYGLKPTHGGLPMDGVFPFVDSFDDVGPFAGSVADLAVVWEVLASPVRHPGTLRDPAPSRHPSEGWDLVRQGGAPLPGDPSLRWDDGLRGRDGLVGRVAILGGWFLRNLSGDMRAALDALAAQLGGLETVELPDVPRARSAAYVMTAAEGGARHLPELRARAMDFDPQTRDRLIAGAMVPTAQYLAAQAFRRVFRDAAERLFERFDVLITPCVGEVAPRIDDPVVTVDGARVPARAHLGLLTQPLSFIGLPVIAAPLRRDGLPLGVQLVGRPGGEAKLFALAAKLEAEGLIGCPLPLRDSRAMLDG
jgi:aspartyl-tRNA(Asn)/glutamyl-tRNA(Gln) amidotransferase subunit A